MFIPAHLKLQISIFLISYSPFMHINELIYNFQILQFSYSTCSNFFPSDLKLHPVIPHFNVTLPVLDGYSINAPDSPYPSITTFGTVKCCGFPVHTGLSK
jgi:hypothetical protein